jgi:hypothetical protein
MQHEIRIAYAMGPLEMIRTHMTHARRLMGDRRGVTALEYAMLGCGLVLSMLAAIRAAGDSGTGVLARIASYF